MAGLEKHPDWDEYLMRIGFSATPRVTADGLGDLHLAHMGHVPFENLDVLVGRPLMFTKAGLFDKIVTRRRGGYCFELNALYLHLLCALGFTVRPHLARVLYDKPRGRPPRTHLVLSVVIGGQTFLTDVGFGGHAARCPLPLACDRAIDDGDGRVRITRDSFGALLVQRESEAGWQDQFSTDLQVAYPSDILDANRITETFPGSKFRKGLILTRTTRHGRVVLRGQTLRQMHHGSATDRDITDTDDLLASIDENFGLDPDFSPRERSRLEAKAFAPIGRPQGLAEEGGRRAGP